MGKKEGILKRKVEKPTEESDERDSGAESVDSEDELFNVVNGDGDSSDSDGDVETSDEEGEEEQEEADDEEEEEERDTDEEEEEEEESGEEEEGSADDEEEEEVNESEEETPNPSTSVDEYAEHDTSDEEDIRTTVGNIPKTWYDDYKHLGYDWDGQPLIKPPTGDRLDTFLKRLEDPDFWRTVKDPQTGQNVVLSPADIDLIRRVTSNKIPDATYDDYAPWIEWFSSQVMETPVRKFPEHKRSFLPSRSDASKISKLVHALKMGWIKTRAEDEALRAKKEPQFYMLWASDDQAEEMRRIHAHIAPPKRHLPGHAESYNPPPEYLFDAKEMKHWNKHKNTPWKRKLHFVPQKHDSLRQVPAYSRYIKERFLRCLDLYLCPRGIKMKLNIEPESLVPKLPSPRDLQPFPTVLSIEYKGHGDMVRSISTDKTGQFLVSGSDDGSIKLWEVNTGRCLKTIATDGVVRSVEWCPNAALSLILVASGNRVLLINPHLGDFLVCGKTDSVLESPPPNESIVSERLKTTVEWCNSPEPDQFARGIRIVLRHFKEVSQVTWHGKGDYFATVMPDGLNRSVLISQISRRRSQLPFTKSKGLVQRVLFHPTKPFLFVATQRHVRIYDLVKQNLMKKLLTNSKWISTMAIHPLGDNLLVGTYDRKMLWFDLDLSTKPYQTLRLHGTAVRGVAFHKRYPLFASGSDDKSLIISHGMVYNDLLKNPLIVPLKRLQDHESNNDFGIFDVLYHPLQPWVFSAGADGTVKLYCN